jgi:hypothetical protein
MLKYTMAKGHYLQRETLRWGRVASTQRDNSPNKYWLRARMQTGSGDSDVESQREMTARGISWARLHWPPPAIYHERESEAQEGELYFANRKQFVHRNEMDSQCNSSRMIYDVRQHKLISVALHFLRLFFQSVVCRARLNLSWRIPRGRNIFAEWAVKNCQLEREAFSCKFSRIRPPTPGA